MGEAMTRRRFLKVTAVAAGTAVVGGGAVKAATNAPEPQLPSATIGEGMSKVLVVYGTKSGCTAGIAERIADKLAAQGVTAELVAAEEAPSAEGFDAVIVGSGVRGGTWHAAASSWVTANAAALKSMPTAFYTCGLMITEGEEKRAEVAGYTNAVVEASGVEPVDVGLFAGWNEPKAFSFLERGIMKMMKAPQGDFRDWDAIEAWTVATAPKLGLAS